MTVTYTGVHAVGGWHRERQTLGRWQDAPLTRARQGRCGRSRSRTLIAQLQLASQVHGDGERLWIVDLDVKAEKRLQSRHEDMHFLDLSKRSRTGQERLELVLILDDGPRSLARHELAKGIGVHRRTETQVQKFDEAAPWRGALVTLDLDVPQLGRRFKVVGSHRNLLLLDDALLMEIRFAAVNER